MRQGATWATRVKRMRGSNDQCLHAGDICRARRWNGWNCGNMSAAGAIGCSSWRHQRASGNERVEIPSLLDLR